MTRTPPSTPEPEDTGIAELFAAPMTFDDAPAFEGKVMRRLHIKLWLRQWLVVLAGGIGGLYALAQFVRLPGWAGEARAGAPDTLRAGAAFIGQMQGDLVNLGSQSMQYLNFLQTPTFFWVSFALCLTLLGLYYAYSQEETL
ncbi:MAG TPA: hypothetical protein VG839_08135 [Asticcacaulis sp.]|nr:hypothetical protein [Asticcacaulis sp.]